MNIAVIAALLGSGICMGLGSLSNGAGIGYVVTGSLQGWVRQPKVSGETFRMMLIAQASAATPSIFALVTSLVLLFFVSDPSSPVADSWPQAAAYLSAGLCLGLGSIGSGLGCGLVGSDSVEATARAPRQSGKVLLYMLVGQAWCQTPNILALVIGLMLIFTKFGDVIYPETITEVARLLAVGICMGAGAIGTAVGSGIVGGQFCRALSDNPKYGDSTIRNTFFVGAAVAQSTSIYAFVVSLLMLL